MDRDEEFADLPDDFDRVTQRFERANTAATGLFTGNDQSGQVTVVVSEVGHFQDLRVSWNCRSDSEPAKLKSDCRSARNTLETKVINESAGILDGHWPAGAVS